MSTPSALIQLSFDKILQTRAYTSIVLAYQDKKFSIYAEPSVGKILQFYLSNTDKARPLTHDLFSSILKGLEIRVLHVIINDVHDTIYYARIFLEQQQPGLREILEIDARPSDAIILALMHNAPVFTYREILEKVIPLLE